MSTTKLVNQKKKKNFGEGNEVIVVCVCVRVLEFLYFEREEKGGVVDYMIVPIKNNIFSSSI